MNLPDGDDFTAAVGRQTSLGIDSRSRATYASAARG
jgi:hypothetical protein